MSQAEIKIDGEGDVILELPMIPSGNMHLLVSSKVLSFVSPVLAKIFTWDFRSCPRDTPRDTPSSTEKVPVIPFPEDELEVFILLCRIAHHQIDDLPKELPLDLLVKFANTCDKYGCVRTVRHTSFRWLHGDIDDLSSVDLNRHLYCAYVLDIPEAFEDISNRILMSQDGGYDSLPGFTDQALAPISILGDFHRTHAKIAKDITDSIQRTIHAAAKGECPERGLFVAQYICDLAQKKLWPISDTFATGSLEDVILATMPKPPKATYCESSTCNFCRNRKHCSIQDQTDVWQSYYSVCLDCVRTGGISYREGKCRVRHPV